LALCLQIDRGTEMRSSGFTLVELLIVIVISFILLSWAVINLRVISTIKIDAVATEVIDSIAQARREAIRGKADASVRRFDLRSAPIAKPSGIKITGQTPSPGSRECGQSTDPTRVCSGSPSICISGEPFCYSSGETITFDRFSGRTQYNRVIFITNKYRTLAVTVNQEGRFEIVELNKQSKQWYPRINIKR
jgi:prepilin-type N-terminal cleavage/methylation domain-containing protein